MSLDREVRQRLSYNRSHRHLLRLLQEIRKSSQLVCRLSCQHRQVFRLRRLHHRWRPLERWRLYHPGQPVRIFKSLVWGLVRQLFRQPWGASRNKVPSLWQQAAQGVVEAHPRHTRMRLNSAVCKGKTSGRTAIPPGIFWCLTVGRIDGKAISCIWRRGRVDSSTGITEG